MTTLRDAAQQALKVMESAEVDPHSSDAVYKTITALRAALEEPVQEPVAWMCIDESLAHKGYSRFSRTCAGDWNIPVYTAPPQRKPLTEEEIRECAQAMDAEPLAEGWHELIKFARAIERAHGIGGQDD